MLQAACGIPGRASRLCCGCTATMSSDSRSYASRCRWQLGCSSVHGGCNARCALLKQAICGDLGSAQVTVQWLLVQCQRVLCSPHDNAVSAHEALEGWCLCKLKAKCRCVLLQLSDARLPSKPFEQRILAPLQLFHNEMLKAMPVCTSADSNVFVKQQHLLRAVCTCVPAVL